MANLTPSDKPIGDLQNSATTDEGESPHIDASSLLQIKKTPNSTTLERMYRQALKEMHKLKSPIQPNLTKKRPLSYSSNEDIFISQHTEKQKAQPPDRENS